MPLGTPLLWIVALGLAAYALFKLMSGVANLENYPNDAMGAAKRIGQLASGVVHLALAYAAYRFATWDNTSSSQSGGEGTMDGRSWTSSSALC